MTVKELYEQLSELVKVEPNRVVKIKEIPWNHYNNVVGIKSTTANGIHFYEIVSEESED